MNLQDQLAQVQKDLEAERGMGSQKDNDKISTLEQQEVALKVQIDEEKAKMEQEQAAQVRIQDATEQAAYFLDNLVIEDLTMRELCVGEPQYQMLRIAVQNKIISLAEENSKKITEIQSEEAEKQRQLRAELAQSKLETADYQSKLKNSTDEIDRLNSHVDDLRKEIAVGARNAYKVIDSEEQGKQLKELADQIKASRIHVYDVVPDSEINAKNYTAKRADNGETVTYNWTQAKNYIEIKDPNEVQQFRQQFANKETVSNSALGNETPVDVTPPTAPEATFPDLPSAIPPQVPAVPTTVDQGQQNGEVSATNAGQGQTVEERLSALELDMAKVKERLFAPVNQVA